ncbi:MAG: restriction endonuclease subunit S [Sulfuritalea sp.]|nr:restriction endonuclease subunit S [Sulfuritalea sp.]
MIADLKPYAEYKESGLPWLGQVPGHWGSRRMKFLFRERSQKGFPNETLLAATQSKGVVRKEDYGLRTVTAMNGLENLKLVEVGDFVISLRSFQGGIEVSHARGIISPAYTVLRPRVGFEPRYFRAYFKSSDFISSLTLFVTGIREGQNIDYERLSRAFMPLPPPDEQAAIVRFLDWANGRLERAIRAKRKVIALLGEQKQAIIHRAVTRGLDPSVPLKPSGIPWLGDIPQHWDAPRVKQCARKISKGTTPSTEGREILEFGPVRFLKAENISAGRITEKPRCFIDEETNNVIRRSQLAQDDILFVIAGATLGKTALVPEDVLPANTNQAVAFIRPNSRVVPHFLELWLQSPRIKELIWLSAVQSAQPNLSMADLGKFVIPVPLRTEQEQILEFVNSATKPLAETISRLEREIELLREYRTRLVVDVVTGKLDVREVAARLPDDVPPDTVEDATDLGMDTEAADEEAVA